MIIAASFLVVHANQFAYSCVSSNLLKLFAEFQTLVVFSVSLILRADPDKLKSEGYSLQFYQNLLMVTLLLIFVPIIGAVSLLFYPPKSLFRALHAQSQHDRHSTRGRPPKPSSCCSE